MKNFTICDKRQVKTYWGSAAARRTTTVAFGARATKLLVAAILPFLLAAGSIGFALDAALLWRDRPYPTQLIRAFFIAWNLFLLLEIGATLLKVTVPAWPARLTMEITLATPALLFPAISLLLLAYTNRFLALSALIRTLHASHRAQPDPIIVRQIGALKHRVLLIRNMQTAGVVSIFLCVFCMLLLFAGKDLAGKIVFGLSLVSLMVSLALSLWEIQISVNALNLQISDLETPGAMPPPPNT